MDTPQGCPLRLTRSHLAKPEFLHRTAMRRPPSVTRHQPDLDSRNAAICGNRVLSSRCGSPLKHNKRSPRPTTIGNPGQFTALSITRNISDEAPYMGPRPCFNCIKETLI